MNEKRRKLQEALSYCTGTENYYKHPFYSFVYTDGVKTFCTIAEAFWFLDTIGHKIYNAKDMMSVELKVKDSKAVITIKNHNNRTVMKQDIDYTDCPEGEYLFFVGQNYYYDSQDQLRVQNVLMYSSEY